MILLTLHCPSLRSPRVRDLVQRGLLREMEGGYGARLDVSPDPVALQPVLDLIVAIRGIRGASVEIGGIRFDPRQVALVVECYAHSVQVSDPRAHCWMLAPRPDGLLWPCQFAGPYINGSGVYQHPSSIRAQVEAVLVQRGCAWCPQLRLDEWELEHGQKEGQKRFDRM